jgi:uncharacterized membrane protein YecN with MAPEG domain
MSILPLYAALLALVFVGLSVRTIYLRRTLKIGVGDGSNKHMLRAMRVHANFAEYVPLSLMMLLLVEARGIEAWLMHALCASVLLGRILHAYGVSQLRENFVFRVAGMVMTLTPLLVSALLLLWGYWQTSGA